MMETGLRKNSYWFLGAACGVAFLVLLAVRLDLFQRPETVSEKERLPRMSSSAGRETWMNILQKEAKIGYVHRQFSKTDEGYRFSESILMQVNTMGLAQEVRVLSSGDLHPDLTLASFNMELISGLFRFRARGGLDGKKLTLIMGTPPIEERMEIQLQEKLYPAAGIHEAVLRENLQPGRRKIYSVFDPLTLSHRPFQITVLGEETLTVMGREEKARKVSLDFMGTRQFAWIGQDGAILKEEGFLGIQLVRVSREEALKGLSGALGEDLTEVASIPSNAVIEKAKDLQLLRLRIDGVNERDFFIDGGRQELKGRIVTVRKESMENLPDQISQYPPSKDRKTYLESTPFIQSQDPVIKAQVRAIVLPRDTAPVKAEKLVSWVYQNIRKRPVLSLPGAVETLKNLTGDCNEHAVLLAALARAAGIPADVEAGIVYQNGRFYYHAWNVLYLGRWITADATLGQMPADVTHVRFVRGTEQQGDIVGLIGNIRLKILEQKR